MSEQKYDSYYYYDDPVPYKDILIYPVKVRDAMLFYISIPTLLINKNRIPDVKIIQMKYLDYILHMIDQELSEINDIENSQIIRQFYNLMCLSLKVKISQIGMFWDENQKAIIKISDYDCGEDGIKDVFINGADFEEIKKIICEYNMVELPDDTIDPKFEQAMEEARKFKNKNADIMGSLEDQFVCIMISTSLTLDDIKELTIRKYQKILERVDFKLHYQIYKTAEMSGNVEFKQPIKHWRTEIKNDKYEGLIVDYDSTVDKFTQK